MKKLSFGMALVWLAMLPAEADVGVATADDWYKNDYAVLYKENAWNHAGEFARHFAETVIYHASDGTVSNENGSTWISDGIKEWRADGWVGSEIAGYASNQLNPTTVTFKVKWRDTYTDGSVEFECGWYLADLKGDRWLISQYADIVCSEHGL